MSKTLLHHTLITKYFWHFCWLISLYIFTIWKSIVYNLFCRDGIYLDKILVSKYKLFKVRQWHTTCRWFSRVLRFPQPIKLTAHDITEILLKVALSTTNLAYKHFTLTRLIHVPMDIRIMAVDMNNNVMMFNWFPNDNTDIHNGLNILSFPL